MTKLADEQTANQLTINLLVTEFEFVEGLIPFYRRFELTVLGGAGVVATALLGAVGALESADQPNHSIEGYLLAIGAWAPVFLLLVEIVALTRIRRASLYITERIRPLALELTGVKSKHFLSWECAPTTNLISEDLESVDSRGIRKSIQPSVLRSEPVTKFFVSSAPLLAVLWALSVVLFVAGLYFHPDSVFFGLAAVIAATVLAAYGALVSTRHEGRDDSDGDSPGEPPPTDAATGTGAHRRLRRQRKHG